MQTKYVVSLREEVNIGGGTVVRTLHAVNEPYVDLVTLPSFVSIQLTCGKRIQVNKNNIKAICPE